MADPRATVTIGGIELVADIGQYRPFSDTALGITVFDGIAATTIQDFGFRADRQEGTLSSGGGTSPGLVSEAQIAAIEAMLLAAYGLSVALTDSQGNAGTVKPLSPLASQFEYRVPGSQIALYSYTLRWRWLTLTTRYGVAYTGP